MRIVRWGAALGLGALWWWGVLRLALVPDAGALEGAVAAGGWGLSLLPVHCVPKGRALGRSGGASGGAGGGPVLEDAVGAVVTRAWPPRRSDGGSGPW
ncbi:hypothetical protein OG250_10815 [Streptomyces sp. NBC_00487]|uniref:hypothetical protein n=1 Tax=unclassified Streptomyces TaxID=2593676 RepID=UPI002DDC508B|nr:MULTISPECIES: hypothetical protein [unclassified Streptomyces]WRY95323.1 hypothetical protein OG889_11605 [Streptomyces sp. NBC_00481]